MNDHALRVLEFDKVREIVSRFASSAPGGRRVLGLLPSPDTAEVAARLALTRELLQLLAAGEQAPLDGIRDIAAPLERLQAAGSMLQPAELLDLAATLGAGRRVKAFASRFAGPAGAGRAAAPLLAEQAAPIVPLKQLEDAVLRAIDESGEVRDSASPELRRLRKLIGRTRDEILDRMGRILRDAEARNLAQEQVITVRDDRYVIPLKPNFRHALKGVVHGQSGSRATLFVEPLEVLEQNNRLAELRMEEQAEVERILRELSALLAAERQALAATFNALAAIDAAHALASFGGACGAAVPQLSADRRLRLRAARHPLLVWKAGLSAGGAVVPNDIDLSRDQKVLIISGPNAGGKTVVLKTVGLLCLMAQSGMPVTAAEGSELPVLSDVFADIGDEQSLEQDLSTFSSHVGRIAGILREADAGALVLLDELGSGTDPAEGAALGSAVLARLLAKGCVTVVTTHHSTLKLFGAETSGAVNAAMEFDPSTLRPSYRFISGRPGRSYGLDMAERHGVPDSVIRDARSRLRGDEAALDRLLARIEQDALALRQAREQAEADKQRAAAMRSEAEALQQTARTVAAEAKQKARQEAREVLSTLRQKLKDLGRVAAVGRDELRAERQAVDALARQLDAPAPVPRPEGPAAEPADIHPGDRVAVPRLNRTGTVLFVHKDALEIDAGGVKLRLPARETVLIEAAPDQRTAAASGWSADLEEREGAADRVNLLGLRVDEALAVVERFIDRAAYQNLQQVTVIHGLGTGALKAAVTEYLKGHALVAAIRPGEPAEGGAGVTIAELKR